MRQFLAVAVLGATLALGTGAAFADERGSQSWLDQTQSVSTVSQNGSGDSMVAGGSTAPASPQQGNEPEHRE